ncbi:MAG: 5-oxoprolinase subunit PxpA [Porticoccaceae bacterium]|nr:5-oxoprolinase subunit PxpA [Porticoccaceae bacterium]
MLLNCDLGEWSGVDCPDTALMPHIDLANIACGMHAGGPLTMRRTLALARQHKVAIGAHPGYADPANFGRLSIPLSAEELIALIHYQVAALSGMATSQALSVTYVKPHGALYNDMMANPDIRTAVMQAVAELPGTLSLMLLATADAELHREEAARHGLKLIFETFADRCYGDDGQLLPRQMAGAVHNHARALDQVRQLQEDRSVTTAGGRILPIHADTLCVHGDNPEAEQVARAIRQLIPRQGGR